MAENDNEELVQTLVRTGHGQLSSKRLSFHGPLFFESETLASTADFFASELAAATARVKEQKVNLLGGGGGGDEGSELPVVYYVPELVRKRAYDAAQSKMEERLGEFRKRNNRTVGTPTVAQIKNMTAQEQNLLQQSILITCGRSFTSSYDLRCLLLLIPKIYGSLEVT
jgi:hypothetical protein